MKIVRTRPGGDLDSRAFMCYTFGLGAVPKAAMRGSSLAGGIQRVSVTYISVFPFPIEKARASFGQASCPLGPSLPGESEEGGDVKREQNRARNKSL